ncbi:tetratricopeptide repeat protein [Aquimarina brevivitae]|uniref:TonB-dependent SusC/RagA subfamily outer membrane receptor n=1 Tax=Aquimarina brevivitae TaxID=323412 RepID=A0A4Q7P2C3_9FLAO|nr:tetratricopeptide repeat protein [Aquimarina brevivitae]RZS93904.1 TonB-dependent SusC/RagA subfamily outer membrane receptor [Aquimarina brevivitae]
MGRTFISILLVCFSFCMLKGSTVTENYNFKNIVIYWDASRAQHTNDHQKEFDFLDNYFNRYPNSKVKLIIFNTHIISEKDMMIKSSDWDVLKAILSNVTYDGVANYKLIKTDHSVDELMLFSSAAAYLGEIDVDLYAPRIVALASSKKPNIRLLYELAFYSGGYYANLTEVDIPKTVQALQEKKTLPRLQFVKDKSTTNQLISGFVYSNDEPLLNAKISIPKKNIATLSNDQGKYTIEAQAGDEIVYQYNGKKTSTIILNNEKTINVALVDTDTTLETVFIKSEVKTTANNVLIGDKVVDKSSLGYDVQQISSEAISADEVNLGEAMAGKFAGVQMGGGNDPGQMIIRGFDSFTLTNHPLFIIDGIPLPRSRPGNTSPMDLIDPNNIASISVLKGLAATNRYGSEGNSGVVLIKTKTGTSKVLDKPIVEKELQIDYKTYTKPLVVAKPFNSPYQSVLASYSSIDLAYSYFVEQVPQHLNTISFFTESADYFFEQGAKQKGTNALTNLIALFPEDTSILKIVAFKLEQHQVYELAQETYKKIIDKAPTLAQTYLDLANCYATAKNYPEALKLFKAITTNKINAIESFEGLQNQIRNDFKALLKKRDNSWNLNGIPKSLFYTTPQDLRIIIEFSHPQTNYKLQYINPNKNYFILTHTTEENQKTLLNELKEGITSEEFVLSATEKGTWFLNLILPITETIDYENPKFLRIKVYTNYNNSDEKMDTYHINLGRVSGSELFAKFTI